ncbi:hypothetical protein D9611_007034 [Ephemerocybe angulata]|uniref:FIST domain-containing protein n=1 Tax=Ephemerocybe angulata TaxID=980116 RepID=A0A8H5B0Z0_9AGAR|nr:hypothetical protein D9611_007034 [Tulosesus angulatus]
MPLHLTTILARNPSILEHHIRNVVERYTRQNLICFFALTANDAVDWTRYWQLLRSINESQTVGCLSSTFSGVKTPRGDLSRYLGCSIGVFDPSEAVCFRSTIQGDRQAQVGRWHSFRKSEEDAGTPWPLTDGPISWDDVWGRRGEAEDSVSLDLGNTRPEDVQSLVYFTDRSYQGLSRSLVQSYPLASKVGLIATPTLTVTELPATLLHQNSILSTGAIGLALKKPYTQNLAFQNLQSISEPMHVDNSQGNIIQSLNGDTNPTQILLRILENTPGTTASNPAAFRFLNEKVFIGQVGADGQPYRVVHLTSGDPSRGGLAVSGDLAPTPGSKVQFFTQTGSPNTTLELQTGSPKKFSFVTVPELVSSDELIDMDDQQSIVLEDVFLAATDVGVVAHRPGDKEVCTGLDCPVGTTVSLEAIEGL